MTEAEDDDIWEQAGEDALVHLTRSPLAPDPDFDEFAIMNEFPAISNRNRHDDKIIKEKENFSSGTLNILSPATSRCGDKTFVKTINTPISEKVINSVEFDNLQTSRSNLNHKKYMPDKIQNLNNISRDSSVNNDLNSLCNSGSIINDLNITEISTRCQSSPDSESSPRNVKSEWDGLERKLKNPNDLKTADSSMLLTTPLFSYQDAVQHFQSLDLSMYEPDIITKIHSSGIANFFSQLCGPPRLKKDLKAEKKFVFCLARCQFDNEDLNDFQLLMTIYKCLTGTALDPSRLGSHWQDIGFQGNDPATDLRGTGMLSLLSILYLIREQKSLAQKLYVLSQNDVQNFPFCIFLINITKIALIALRNGYLNKECNRRLAILPIFCDVFAALSYEHYKIWKSGKTIRDSGFVLKRLEEKTKSSSLCSELINNFTKYRDEKEAVFEKGGMVFLNVCKTIGEKTETNNEHLSQKSIPDSKYATH